MKSEIIIALDYPDAKSAIKTVDTLGDVGTYYKVGLELFIADGANIICYLKERNKKVFLDLKIHDIPNTAAQAIKSCLKYGVDMVNVHAQGGIEMMKACADMVKSADDKATLIAVTLLTSLDEQYLKRFGITKSAEEYVLQLASLTKDAGLDGVVSSAKEVSLIKRQLGADFITVTPGIRPAESNVNASANAKGDQVRVVTPQDAVAIGTDYMVIGRPITKATDPKQALINIIDSIKGL